jgi:hypothetical protein
VRAGALAIVLVAGCGAQMTGLSERGYPSHLECAPADGICRDVDHALWTILRESGGWCGTVRAMAYQELVGGFPRRSADWWRQNGDAHVAALTAALEIDSVVMVRAAAQALVDLGRAERVSAWCASARAEETAQLVCRR